jgi:hypothetical protein
MMAPYWEHPFIVNSFVFNYNPPDKKTLVESFLTQEIVWVNVKLYRLLDNENNLTLGKNVFEIFIKMLKKNWIINLIH